MHLEQEFRIDGPAERAWSYLMDLPAVASCVPGVESIEVVDPDTIDGTVSVRVGPIALHLAGRVRMVERDAAAHSAVLEVQATDRRLGAGVNARTAFRLGEPAGGATVLGGGTILGVVTDATLLGKLAQFGQPIIRRKADEMAEQFVLNVVSALSASPA